MNLLFTMRTAALLPLVVALGLSTPCSAQSLVETFEGGTVLPPTTFFTHDGSAFSQNPLDVLDSEGLPNVGAFAGAGGGSVGSAVTSFGLSATGGVGGSQAAQLTFTNEATNFFAFGGVVLPIGAVANPTNFTASVDVLAPVGFPLSLRVESPFNNGQNFGFELNFVGTGQFETISGVVGTDLTPIPGGPFDASSSFATILVANQIGANLAVGTDQEVFIDNFSFAPTQSVPEPGALAFLMIAGGLLAVGRRRT